jgi:tripartite-type tricarboxylate transporter receptor subunit TctC
MATPASLKAKHFTKPLYNAATDFTPVVLITTQPTFFVVRTDLPAENPREFSLCKGERREMQFGSAGAGDPLGLRADQLRDSMSRMFLTWRSTRDAGLNRRSHRLSNCHLCPSCMRAS